MSFVVRYAYSSKLSTARFRTWLSLRSLSTKDSILITSSSSSSSTPQPSNVVTCADSYTFTDLMPVLFKAKEHGYVADSAGGTLAFLKDLYSDIPAGIPTREVVGAINCDLVKCAQVGVLRPFPSEKVNASSSTKAALSPFLKYISSSSSSQSYAISPSFTPPPCETSKCSFKRESSSRAIIGDLKGNNEEENVTFITKLLKTSLVVLPGVTSVDLLRKRRLENGRWEVAFKAWSGWTSSIKIYQVTVQ